jgi:acetyltransferase-like isoleucine patch superfamily enzyme
MNEHVGQKLNIANFIPKVINRFRTVVLEFELYLLRLIGHIPSHVIRKFFYVISGINIPFDSTIHMGARFFNPEGITIGHDSIIGNNSFLDGRALLRIGNHTSMASDVMIYNDEHNIHSPRYENTFGPVTIGDYVFIGPRVIILPNVTIGDGAIVAAGAVVTKDIPPFEVWGGVPAKKITNRNLKNPQYTLGRVMLFQ